MRPDLEVLVELLRRVVVGRVSLGLVVVLGQNSVDDGKTVVLKVDETIELVNVVDFGVILAIRQFGPSQPGVHVHA